MAKVRSWVGLDVHAVKVIACAVDAESGEMTVHRMAAETSAVVFCAGLPGPTRVAYEAGPTGYELARALLAAGIECVVAAPGKIERAAQDRIKTDQRDAERLVRLLMIGALRSVRVPTPEEEALRDLVRAREDLRVDLLRARQRLSKLLLRHGVRYEDTGSRWGERHRAWLGQVDLGEAGAQLTLADYVGAIEALELRRGTLEAAIAQLIPSSPWAQDLARLRCLRAIDTLTAIGLCVEIGDFARFEHPKLLMSYLGLVPSEHSTGESRRRGPITKSGSRHARRLLVEAGVALPPPTPAQNHAPAPPGRPEPGRRRDRLEGAATPAPQLAAPGAKARQTPHHHRGRGRPPTRRLLLGDRQPRPRLSIPAQFRWHPCQRATPSRRQPPTPKAGETATTPTTTSMTDQPHNTRLRRRQDQPDPHAREHPRPKHEQPLRRRRSR